MEYGCIGEKLGHSFSKIIHNELADYDYILREIPKCELDSFMKKADFKAINVTIPYKEAVIPYLYETDETAKKIGAVNTIVNKDGRLYGYNTDFSGMTALISRAGISLKDKKVLVLGSGGTSKTAFAVAQYLGASSVLRVSRSSREGLITYDEVYKLHTDADIIINTTPCGMFPNIGGMAVELSAFTNLSGVVDAVYNPLNSALIVEAKKRGISAVGGLYMLVSQAVFAAEKFIDTEFDSTVTESVYKKILSSKLNMVLIGMPSCGKTTVGKALASELKKEFIDTDDEIVKTVGMPITDIINKLGTEKFREYESEVIAALAVKQNCIIATGGGSVLNPENVRLLKENGCIVFIDRPLEHLISTDDRPLSSSREALRARYNERYDIYCSSADRILKVNEYSDNDITRLKEVYINEFLGD